MQITNDEFLTALFGDEAGDAHVCGFADNPADAPRGSWFGTKWCRIGDVARTELAEQNSYFAISVFHDDAAGTARRRKGLYKACHVIVVDDVGTKVKAATASLPAPTWVLETSPGNAQWGYALAAPERDARRVNALLDGLVAAGIAEDGRDPGMKGVTRYVRLPLGVNSKSKYGPHGFRCRLRGWHPERRFTLEDLAGAWGIDLAAGATSPGGGGIISVDPGTDEILALLHDLGMVLGRTTAAAGVEPGYHVRCPWEDEHTDGHGGALTGAAYFPGGGFKCFHGHCDGRRRAAIERWADAQISEKTFGLKRLSTWEGLDAVKDYVPLGRHLETIAPERTPPKTPAEGLVAGEKDAKPTPPTDRFFGEWIFVVNENEFYSTRTGDLVARPAVDAAWARELSGVLPVVNARTGTVLAPSAWFLEPDNKPRARIADGMTHWPGKGMWFIDGDVTFVNTWREGPRDWDAAANGVSRDEWGVNEWWLWGEHACSAEAPWVWERVLDWMAIMICEPGTKPGWHIIMQGGQGLGKDIIAKPMEKAIGDPGNIGRPTANGLHGDFNPWAAKRLVKCAELKQTTKGASTGHDQYNTIKALTENTSDFVRINEKNRKEYAARNVSGWYITSNQKGAVALEDDDRRFLVVMGEDVETWPKERGTRLWRWLEAGGALRCAEWLRQRYETEIAVDPARRDALLGKAPATKGKIAMVRATEDPLKAWVRAQIEDGEWPDLMTGKDVEQRVKGEFRFADGRRLASVMGELDCVRVNKGQQVRLKSGAQAYVWAVRAPERFAKMGSMQIAQAYISGAGHAFSDNVVNFASPDDGPGEAE